MTEDIKTFKEKSSRLQAVEYKDILGQAGAIAKMVGAVNLGVDVVNETGYFTVESDGARKEHEVKLGQVISVIDGVVSVSDAADFYSKYEVV